MEPVTEQQSTMPDPPKYYRLYATFESAPLPPPVPRPGENYTAFMREQPVDEMVRKLADRGFQQLYADDSG